ncbi:MAG TPA: hypothetical protein DD713_02495, partial [Nitrospiraceae bacterium]|nr:hypothetical protein [Nitrospiraceae bacterium]
MLKNFPQNANSRIRVTARSGYDWEESPTGATYFEKKVKDPGNAFIEISRGRENRPLIYSTTPYKMLVTTGAATVVTPQPYQPPVTIQMDKPHIFYNPTYKGYRLDICLTWGSNCQEPAATRFCQEMGYTKAKSWDIAHDIGHITPTYVIADGKICNQSFCDGFKFIECEGAATPH